MSHKNKINFTKNSSKEKQIKKGFLHTSPIEELGGEPWVNIWNLENLSHKFGSDPAKAIQVFDHQWTPAAMLSKGVNNVPSNGGETLCHREEVLRWVSIAGSRIRIRVPFPKVEVEWIIGSRLGGVGGINGLAVGEEAATDGGAILGGFPVTVEEVRSVGFHSGNW